MNQRDQIPSATDTNRGESAASGRETGFRPTASHVVFAAVLYVMFRAHSLLSPILLSFLLIILTTLAVNPIISRIRSAAGGRKRAAGLILAGVVALCALTVWATVAPLKRAAMTLSEKVPAYWERLQKPLMKMEQQGVISEGKMQEEVSAEIAREESEAGETDSSSRFVESLRREAAGTAVVPTKPESADGSLRSTLGEMTAGAYGQIKGVAHGTTDMLVVLVTVFIGVIFTLMNPRPVFGAFFSVVPEAHHVRTLAIMVRIAEFVPRWAGAMLISMLSIGSLFFLLMWPIFGLTDAMMLGLIACLLSAIPILGPLLTLIPALLLAIGEGGMTPVWVVLAYLAVQALESNVILPIVMSKGMKLHPVAVILSMLLSVAFFGVLGVIIAAPLLAIAGIVHHDLYRKRFLPTTTDQDLDRLARGAIHEKPAV